LLRVLFFRAALIALPIVIWFVWADISRRRGKPMGSAPWIWLVVAGVALAAASLLVTGLMDVVHPSGEEAPLRSNAGPPHGPAPAPAPSQ
jgi:drug/metabolite transporter (DMT)-like permease